MKTIFIWKNIGPYHAARMQAIAQKLPGGPVIVEMFDADGEHPWPAAASSSVSRIGLWKGPKNCWTVFVVALRLLKLLAARDAQIAVIPGYHSVTLIAAAICARLSGKKTVLYFVSQRADKRRRWWKEIIKQALIRFYDFILVTGERAAEYVSILRYPPGRVFRVGDVVDNEFFRTSAGEAKQHEEEHRKQYCLPAAYFFYAGRFAKEKNLFFLLEAYGRYRESVESPWSLVLAGGGPEENRLKNWVRDKQLAGVEFFRFQQPPELAVFYALAKALVLPSESEPWGLVVNEAAACSLPLLLSNRCGCLPELLREGENGFSFEPHDREGFARRMKEFSDGTWDLKKFGGVSLQLVEKVSLESYADKMLHALRAVSAGA